MGVSGQGTLLLRSYPPASVRTIGETSSAGVDYHSQTVPSPSNEDSQPIVRPRVAGAQGVYHAAELFRQRCLVNDKSLLWPDAEGWNLESISTLISAIADFPDTGKGSFLDKLQGQLDGKSEATYRVAADVVAIAAMWAERTLAATKKKQVSTIISWLPTLGPPDDVLMTDMFRNGIGVVGVHYSLNIFRAVVYYMTLARRIKVDRVAPYDLTGVRQIADELAQALPQTGEARNIILHLLFPDSFEAIAGVSNKRMIVRAFPHEAAEHDDVDDALVAIRRNLTSQFGPQFSFYDPEVWVLWKPGAGAQRIRESFGEILKDYPVARQSAPFSGDHPLFAVFQRAVQTLLASEPVKSRPHLRVRFSAGQGNWARVPWIAVLDDRETTTTQRGIYIVYLFRQDGTGVYATLNQGVTEPQRQRGPSAGKLWLRDNARKVRLHVDPLKEKGFLLDDGIDLRVESGLGADYEASTIAYKLYSAGALPDDSDVLGDLESLAACYAELLVPQEVELVEGEPEEVVSAFSEALSNAGVSFGSRHDRVVRSFVASLMTKPLVILTGLSGSGKTQIAIKFGQWLGDEHFQLVPVRPDWTGPEALMGYEDVLSQPDSSGRRTWSVPSAMQFILRAARDPQNPYLLVLDEMNLAHVERYFADFLSGMESRLPILENLVQDHDGLWRLSADDPSPLPLPRNLFVVGTVNVDETTYMFSPKVLDRANTLEFRVLTDDLGSLSALGVLMPGPVELTRSFLTVATTDDLPGVDTNAGLDEFPRLLKNLHRILSEFSAEFGYRSFYEANRFAAIFLALGAADADDALDAQVMQKVLPRLHGARRKLEPILRSIGRFCLDYGLDDDAFDVLAANVEDAQLPVSLEKVQRMTRALHNNQFAAFAE